VLGLLVQLGRQEQLVVDVLGDDRQRRQVFGDGGLAGPEQRQEPPEAVERVRVEVADALAVRREVDGRRVPVALDGVAV
jgi:hypothetical protein